MATGTVAGTGRWIGGLIGSARDGAVVVDSYASGAVSAAMGAAGGLVGNTEGTATLARVYAQNVVTSRAPAGVLGEDTGGGAVVGTCYFDAARTAADPRCVGLTSAEMSDPSRFVGFDFTTPVWRIDRALRDSPVLDWQ